MKYHMKRSDLVEIIDINREKLRQIDYNTFMNSENLLEKALYIFICDDKERLDKVYKGDKLIEEKNSLIKDAMLYYDRDKMFLNACYNKGYSKGKTEGYNNAQTSIAKEFLKLEVPIEKIMLATALSEKEILALKNE